MIVKNILSIISNPSLTYPGESACFSPSTKYPEYSLGELSTQHNAVYEAVRHLFFQAGLDRDHFATPAWNPLGEIIKPGNQVFILCNFVYHRRQNESTSDFFAKCTHASVLRAVADYILIAVGPSGRVLFGNAPLQSCRWASVLSDSGTDKVARFYQRRGLPVKPCDLRLYVAEPNWTLGSFRVERLSEREAVPVDLGSESLLDDFSRSSARFRVTDYDPRRIESFHHSGRHVYLVNRRILESDVIFSIPKLKTHEKVGITCAIKGCVGAVAHKDCLAHHRFGPPNRGGDEYPSDSMGIKRLLSYLHDAIQRIPMEKKFGVWLRFLDRSVRHAVRPWACDLAGAWSGNDTCWRMAVDLARILAYAGPDGIMRDYRVRSHVAMVDGILGGEGQGPLMPRAVRSGILLFGDNVVEVDHAAAILMGYAPDRLPIIRKAAGTKQYSLSSHLNEQSIVFNGVRSNLEHVKSNVAYRYVSPKGWHDVLTGNGTPR